MKSVLSVRFEISYLDRNNVPIVITTFNNLDKDLYVLASDVFHRSLVDSRIKFLKGPSEVNCDVWYVSYNEEKVLLEARSAIQSRLDLSNVCDFSDALPGNYFFELHTSISPCFSINSSNCEKSVLVREVGSFMVLSDLEFGD